MFGFGTSTSSDHHVVASPVVVEPRNRTSMHSTSTYQNHEADQACAAPLSTPADPPYRDAGSSATSSVYGGETGGAQPDGGSPSPDSTSAFDMMSSVFGFSSRQAAASPPAADGLAAAAGTPQMLLTL